MESSATYKTDCMIVGAGVIGLAIAREFSLAGREVIVIEAADDVGTGISSRNSEVIHAGIYYPQGSLKAELCVRGKMLLYEYCRARDVAHKQCGKVIVACDGRDTDRLQSLRENSIRNGVDDLEWLARKELEELSGTIRCHSALLSPSTGIVDSHGLMMALQADAQSFGAQIVLKTPMEGAEVRNNGIVVRTAGSDPARILCRTVVNAAGLSAVDVASSIEGLDKATVPKGYLAKGNYFAFTRKSPFRRLIYPLPEPGGLGIHVTLDLANQVRFGPDVEWIEEEDYTVDAERAEIFYKAIRKYWPSIPGDSLMPAYAGIRPKICGPGEPDSDFRIVGPEDHGIPGLINLFGIESPGLTASMALAKIVVERIEACAP